MTEQNVGTVTTWNYNADNTLATVTDARGATTTLGYAGTNRGLVKTVAHTLSGSPTINVSYNYDAVGNRTFMSDPSGTLTYAYNQLSQLTSEARTFAGVTGSYALSYDYNLAGALKLLSIPFSSQQVGYTYDNAARLSGVTASGFSASYWSWQTQQEYTHTLTSFASNILYRAWGGRKSMTYGNTVGDSVPYDSRMKATTYTLSNVNYSPSWQTVLTSLSWTYDYYNDGRLNFSHHSSENKWDRSYAHDQVGRLSDAKTNRLARGQSWDFWNPDPYEQTITYDPFDHSSRSGRLYRGYPSDSGNYVNNRRVGAGWTYDSAGNVTFDQSYSHVFDAAGKNTGATSTAMAGDGSQQFPSEPVTELTSTYDADGRPSKRLQITRQNIYEQVDEQQTLVQVLADYQTSYYLRSSVLGGNSVVEFSPDGSGGLLKRFGNIYANGQRIAKEQWGSVNFEHHNPGKDGWIVTNGHPDYRITWREERDPFGGELPMSDPFESEYGYPEQKWGQPLFIEGGDPFDFRGGMMIDGMPVSVTEFNRRMQNGSAGVQLSVGGAPIAFVTNQQRLRHITFDVFDVDNELRGLPQSQRWGGTYYRGSFEVDLEVGQVPSSQVQTRPPQNTYDPRVDFRDYALQLSTNGQTNDCLKLALLAYKAGQVFTDSIGGLLQGLTERAGIVGTSDPNYRVGVLRRDPYFGNSFTGSGFLPQFSDPGNQVRHFVGWFAVGAYLGPRGARRALYDEEGTSSSADPDVALGHQAINMGWEFSKTNDYTALAKAIWRDVCGGKSALKLP